MNEDAADLALPEPSVEDPAAVRQLGVRLREASYSEGTIAASLGTRRRAIWNDGKLPLYLRRTQAGTPLDTLTRLFTLGVPTKVTAAERAFASLPLDRLAAMGVVIEDPAGIRSTVAISPHKGLLLAHDPWGASVPSLPRSVPGLAPSPLWLDTFTVRRPVTSALDIGTGSGVQALLAARHSDRVTATDVNDRALGFCKFNAVLNGIDRITTLRGDLFRPVVGERFDLVVCNPPYVVSPERRLLFSDGGLDADGICQRLVTGLPAQLTDGGFGCVVANWPLHEGEGWSDPPKRWCDASECDALILLDRRSTPLTYAASMNSYLVGDSPLYDEALRGWTTAYIDAGISEIVEGVIILRKRRAPKNWIHTVEAQPVKGDASDHLIAMFEGRTNMTMVDEVLNRFPRLVEGCDLRERNVVGQDKTLETQRTVRRATGVQFVEELNDREWELLHRCDGTRSLLDLLTRSGMRSTQPRDTAIAKLRTLAALGMIEFDVQRKHH